MTRTTFPLSAGLKRALLPMPVSICSLLWVAAVGAMMTFPFRALAQELKPAAILSGPGVEIETGGRVSLWLTLLNDSTEDLTGTFPDRLRGRLTGNGLDETVELSPKNAGEAAAVKLAAGRFARRAYEFNLPADASGRMTVEIVEPAGFNRIVIDVKPRGIAEQEKRQDSAFARFFKEAVPQGEPFDAGAFFKQHISGYDPLYFLAGTETPNAKFQISLKYQIINAESRLAEDMPALKGVHFAYSQTSLWDWNGDSAPFFDSSYRPELLYLWERAIGGRSSNWFRLDLQAGAQHESNGKDGDDSRSLNIVYLRPTLTFGQPDRFQLSLSPRAWIYVMDLEKEEDWADYRGYVDLRVVAGWAKGVQLSAVGRMGDDWNRGSVQLDLTYPMMKLLSGSFSLYLHAQYFNGYGESLLLYNERGDSLRVGFSLYR